MAIVVAVGPGGNITLIAESTGVDGETIFRDWSNFSKNLTDQKLSIADFARIENFNQRAAENAEFGSDDDPWAFLDGNANGNLQYL